MGWAACLGESMLQLPGVGWGLLACKNGASPDCIIVVEWLHYSKKYIDGGADLIDFFPLIFRM